MAIAAAGPLLWALSDLIVAGSPLHSLTGTRDTARELRRITGLDDVPGTVPRRIGEILREPVLFGAAGGLVFAWLWLRDRAVLAIAAAVLGLAAFCVLAATGLPILGRYLLLPATIGAILCGAGAFGWMELPRGDRRRRPWAWFGLLTLVLLVAFTPAQVDRIQALRCALSRQDAIQDDLRALVAVAAGADLRALPADRRAEPPAGPAAGAVARPAAAADPEPAERPDRARRATCGRRRPTSRTTTSSTRATCARSCPSRRRASGSAGGNESWLVYARCG